MKILLDIIIPNPQIKIIAVQILPYKEYYYKANIIYIILILINKLE